jgi:peptide/nickel transport system substrate-binding protein
VSALKAGEVDLMSGVSPDQFDELKADARLTAMWKRSVRTPLVSMFPESPDGGGEPLKNQSVRQALNHAVNVDAILKFLLNGMGERTATLMTPDFPFFDPSVKAFEYDPAKAKQLLTEAGFPNGFELNFDVPSTAITIKPVEVAQAIAADLAKVGVKANVRPQEFATAVKLRDERKIAPLYLWSWGGATLDADDKFFSLYAKESPYTTFPVDAEIDRLVVEGRTTVDEAKRKPIYAELQQRVKNQAASVFLYAQPDAYAINKRLTWQARSDERIFLWNADLKT